MTNREAISTPKAILIPQTRNFFRLRGKLPYDFPDVTENKADERQCVARVIRQLRAHRSQRSVAERAGLSPTTWSFYETGRRMPGEDARRRIAKGLGVTYFQLEEAIWRVRRQELLQEQEKASGKSGRPASAPGVRQVRPASQPMSRAEVERHIERLSYHLRAVLRYLSDHLG